MKHILPLLVLFFSAFQLSAQYDELRYRAAIFTSVDAQTNVQYGSAPQWVFPYWNEDLKLNVYRPVGDALTKRPLIIFAHAGGFLNGSKDVDDMVALCDSFARKGYVTATIDYRKGFNPLDAESAERAVYRGVQDGKAAVRFFKEKANLYGIDTNYIYFGGMSAGGFMALHVAYMNLESERPASTYGGGTVNNLGCLDCAGNSYTHSSRVRAILNYWGAIADTSMMVSGDTPILSMHGMHDPTVPYNYGQPFGLFTLPHVMGSYPVTTRANNVGIYNEFVTSNRLDAHMLDGSDNGTFNGAPHIFWYDTLLPVTTKFLVKMTKTNPSKISADTLFVCHNEFASLKIQGLANNYKRWYYNASSVTGMVNNNTDSIRFKLTAPGVHRIGVVEFNDVHCASDTLWFTVIQQEPVNANFDFSTNDLTTTFTNESTSQGTYFWTFGDGQISTEQDPTHTYEQSGTYNVSLTIATPEGCTKTVTKTVVVSHLALVEATEAKFIVYPVPMQDKLTLQWENEDVERIQMLDIMGRLIKEYDQLQGKEQLEIPTNLLPKSTYFIVFVGKDGYQRVVEVTK